MTSTSAVVLAALSLLAAKSQIVSGLVEDASGKPLAGAAVWMSSGWTLDGTTPALSRAMTDGHGKFTLTVPHGVPRSAPSLESLSIWAYQAGSAPGRVHVGLSSESDREEVRIALPLSQTRRVTLLRPDGKPLQGATIKPAAMGPSNAKILRYYLSVPEELADHLALRTDRQGKVEIPYLDQGSSPLMTITTSDLGIQQIQLQPDREKPITLRPVGRVSGRVVSDDPAAARGILVYLGTQYDGKDTAGRASTRTDNEGRFVVDAVAEGSMLFMIHPAPESPYRPAQGAMTQISAGRENVLKIELKRGVRVRGLVRERGTNRPIPGVGVFIGSQYQMNVFYSDAEGQFEEYVLPGTIGIGIYPWMTPRPFYPLAQQPVAEVEVPANVSGITRSNRSSWRAEIR